MSDALNNPPANGANTFDRALERGLANRLTLIVGPDAHARNQELNDWLASLGHESLRIHCSPEDDPRACPERIVEAFASAGIIEPVTEAIESADDCLEHLVQLMNCLAAFPGELVVVLLDYRPCEQADQVLSFILEHLPQQVHLYLLSEDVPCLSCIPRRRVRRQLQMIETSAD